MSAPHSSPPPPPVVLVTGCGSGLGLALARLLAQNPHFRTMATTHTQSSATALRTEIGESDTFRVAAMDVTSTHDREQVVASIIRLWGQVDAVVNNAAVCFRSVIEHMDEDAELDQMNVNYLAPMALIRLLLPIMRERGSGQIINVSSVSGSIAMPTMASYSASKHALEGATEALWYELRPFGIAVNLIQPGFINSSSYEKVRYSKKAKLSQLISGPYSDYYSAMEPFIARWMHRSMSNPEAIARRIIDLLGKRKGSLRNPATLDAKFLLSLRWLLPHRWFYEVMLRQLPNNIHWGLAGNSHRSPADQPWQREAL